MAPPTAQPTRHETNPKSAAESNPSQSVSALIHTLSPDRRLQDASGIAHTTQAAHHLRTQLAASPDLKDAFRREGGFEQLLDLLKDSQSLASHCLARDDVIDGVFPMLRAILLLLSVALSKHRGNTIYFVTRLDGWSGLCDAMESLMVRIRSAADHQTVIRNFSAVVDCLCCLALQVDDFSGFADYSRHISNVSDIPHAPLTSSVDFRTNAVVHHPEACLVIVRIISAHHDGNQILSEDENLILTAAVDAIRTLADLCVRNIAALWRVGILSHVLPLALNATLHQELRLSCERLVCCLGRLGLAEQADVALLYSHATGSEVAKDILLRLLDQSKQPAFFQLDMQLYGFSSIEIPSLPLVFPPQSGFTITAWLQIDQFDPNTHTTLFGAFDSGQACFVLLYLEKDSHQLILQTAMRGPAPSVRFKATRFVESRWYHVVLVHRRNAADPTQSIAYLFIDGDFVEQRKCFYPQSPEGRADQKASPASTTASTTRRPRPVQAFFGTPRDLAPSLSPKIVGSKWSLANARLYNTPLTDEFIAVQYHLGLRYRGNLQDCLGPLLTYRASADLNLRNELLHPDKSEKSDIVTATERRGSEVVDESLINFGINASAVLEFDDDKERSTRHFKGQLDTRSLPRYHQLSQTTHAIAFNTALPSTNDAIRQGFGAAIVTGEPVLVSPRPLDDATWCLSGCLPVFQRLLDSATTASAFLKTVKIVFACVKDNWRNSEAMEKGHGFGILALIIRDKLGLETGLAMHSFGKTASSLGLEDRSSLSLGLLQLILEFVGYNPERTDCSMLVNPMAYRVLLLDFDTWRRCDLSTQQLYWRQFGDFVTRNRYSAFNQKRLIRMRIGKKLAEALKSEFMTTKASMLVIESIKVLLNTTIAQSLYRELAMFVTYGLNDHRALPHQHSRNGSVLPNRKRPVPVKLDTAPSTGAVNDESTAPDQAISRYELAVLILNLLADIIREDETQTTIRRFQKAVPHRWLLHLQAESDERVMQSVLAILSQSMLSPTAEFRPLFVDRQGFTLLTSHLRSFWQSSSIWKYAFALLLGCLIPRNWLNEEFTAFHLVELLNVNVQTSVANPEMLPVIFGMLEEGLQKIRSDAQRDDGSVETTTTVVHLLTELCVRSPRFHDFATESNFIQEIIFVLFPLLAGVNRFTAEAELQSTQGSLASHSGEDAKKSRPHSSSVDSRPSSARGLDAGRSPSPLFYSRPDAAKRLSSFVLVGETGTGELNGMLARFHPPMSPEIGATSFAEAPHPAVESLLEIVLDLIVDQICHRDKYTGMGLFMKVPPGPLAQQARFQSYLLTRVMSRLLAHLRVNRDLLTETKLLTNLARYVQHMAEAFTEGWFIEGAQALLDFTGEVLEHLQQPDIANVKAVRLCSQSINSIRVVFLRATLWRMSDLNDSENERHTVKFLDQMMYWQMILFSAENQETLFTKLICFLLYQQLVSPVQSVRLAAVRLWRIVLVQKPTEAATILSQAMGPEKRHLSTAFMKLVSMDDEDFLTWVQETQSALDAVFNQSLSGPWNEFVQNENRAARESNRVRVNKRREKLRQWQADEVLQDNTNHKFEISTSHWRSNVHAQERVKLQRAQQDHQENVNHLHAAYSKTKKVMNQPCGVWPSDTNDKWRLDDIEAASRMRMRMIPHKAELSEVFRPKSKSTPRSRNESLTLSLKAVNQIEPVKSNNELHAPQTPATPGLPSTPIIITSDDNEVPSTARIRSSSTSDSQLLEGGFEVVDDPKEDEDGAFEDKNRKIMTSLQRGDAVRQLYNVSRVMGLEACEGLLVIGESNIYMKDNFFQRSDGEIVSVSQAPEDERDPYLQLISGQDLGSPKRKPTTGESETRHWAWAELISISKRRFLLRDVSIEIFFSDGRSYLLTCQSSKVRDELYNSVSHKAPHVHSPVVVSGEDAWRLDTLRIPEVIPQSLGTRFGNLFQSGPAHAVTKKWMRGEMSNFQYLMLINTMAGRTFNDLTQYPVFPWVLADYKSDVLDLENPKSFRDFSKPMGCQNPAREAEFRDRFTQFAEMGDHNAPPFHYGTHYSSAMIVSSYLIRLQPFVQSYLLLQGGTFDHADRLFDSVEKAWLSASRDNMSDVRELVPEFFYLPEFLSNINKYDFGNKQATGQAVNDVILPKWAQGDPQIFVAKHREALESTYVSQNLHQWIDLVFGFKQRGEAAIEATNVFQHLSYEGAKDLDKIDDPVERLASINIIHSFGQTPNQIFFKAHPARELDRQLIPKLDLLAESLIKLPDVMLQTGEKVADFTYSVVQERLLAAGPCKLNVLPNCDRYMQWSFTDSSVRFFSMHSKRLLGLVENAHNGPLATAIFVDSKTLVTGGMDSTVGVWKLKLARDSVSMSPKNYLFGHRTPISVLAASRVFSTLLSASIDGQVILWGINRLDCIRVLRPAKGPRIQAARVSNVSGHILLCEGSKALLYTLNGHLLVEQKLCDREDEVISCCSFYEGNGSEYLERELIFTGHAHGITNVWALAMLSDGSWCLQLVKRMSHLDHARDAGSYKAAAITSILPMPKAVYTGDEEGNVWDWETVQRQHSSGGRTR